MKKPNLQIAAPLALMLILNSSCVLHSHETTQKLDAPGFRPASDQAASFLEKANSSTIAVFPSILRTIEGTTFPEGSQQAIAQQLKESGIATAIPLDATLTMEPVKGGPQYQIFQKGISSIGPQTAALSGKADYFLALEFLVTPTRPGGLAVGGIHCYLLDAKGQNAFSFLLNSHHKLFVDANLVTSQNTPNDKNTLVLKATQIAIQALQGQINAAK